MTVLVAGAPAGTTRYSLHITDDPDLVEAAQRLRFRVFAEELGAALPAGRPGIDTDEFDARCDHLIVREDISGEVVGTYRMLPPGRGNLYSDREFDLTGLAPLRDRLVETGRSCVHPEHRTGAVINLMWAGIARYLHLKGFRWLAGCASVPVADVPAVWLAIQPRLAPPPMWVAPYLPCLPGTTGAAGAPSPVPPPPTGAGTPPLAAADARAVPPLLKGYLRLGAWVCGPPAYDTDFGVGDFFVLLTLDRINPRYLRHFLGQP